MSELNLPTFQAQGLTVIGKNSSEEEITMMDPFMNFSYVGNNLKTGGVTLHCVFYEKHNPQQIVFDIENMQEDPIFFDETGDIHLNISSSMFKDHYVIKNFKEVEQL